METLKRMWQNKDFRVFVWNLFNVILGGIGVLITYLSKGDTMVASAIALIGQPLLNQLTKYINTRWFGDMGVVTQ